MRFVQRQASGIILPASLALSCCGCSVLGVVQLIPTLFAIQSRLDGCPGEMVAVGQSVELTFVVIMDDGTESQPDQLEWSLTRGIADIDDSNGNPAVVTLSGPGIITVRAQYLTGMNVNPATCSMLVE